MTSITTHNSFTARQARNLSQAPAGLMGRLVRHWQYVKTINELQTLTDRELDDIGLTRGDIPGAARMAIRRGLF